VKSKYPPLPPVPTLSTETLRKADESVSASSKYAFGENSSNNAKAAIAQEKMRLQMKELRR